MAYPGGKNGSGIYQTLINLIPPHDIYIETHLGGGAVMKHKRPARKSIGIDLDPDICSTWQQDEHDRKDLHVVHADAVEFLKAYDFSGNEFVYCDPPYMMDTRKSGQLYLFEYDDEQHIDLLRVITELPCKVMISGYWSDLYGDHLDSWSVQSFEAQTRGGTPATEFVWFNYPKPTRLHDYNFLGTNFRERERIKRKKKRWIKRLEKMPVLERMALLSVIDQEFSEPKAQI